MASKLVVGLVAWGGVVVIFGLALGYAMTNYGSEVRAVLKGVKDLVGWIVSLFRGKGGGR